MSQPFRLVPFPNVRYFSCSSSGMKISSSSTSTVGSGSERPVHVLIILIFISILSWSFYPDLRSKPQRLCATNCKSSTPDKLQLFRTIFGISCKYLTKLFTWDNTFCFVLKGNFMKEESRNLSGQQGEESMIWDKMSCINGCMVKSNLVISLVPY